MWSQFSQRRINHAQGLPEWCVSGSSSGSDSGSSRVTDLCSRHLQVVVSDVTAYRATNGQEAEDEDITRQVRRYKVLMASTNHILWHSSAVACDCSSG